MDQYLFITTPLMEKTERIDHIASAAGIREEQLIRVVVEEDNLQDIHERLSALRLNPKARFFINLTGGTKIMSIGVFDFFVQSKLPSEVYYIPFGKNAIQQIYPLKERKSIPLSFRIGLDDYLKGYGIQILDKRFINNLSKSPEFTRKMLEYFLSNAKFTSQQKRLKNFLYRLRQQQDRPWFEFAEFPWLKELVDELEMDHIFLDRLAQSEVQYLIGGWLEEYLYEWIRTELELPDEAIGNNVRIERKNELGGMVSNEFDVMFTHGNALYVVECKTGLGKEQKGLFNNTIYKLSALKSEFGLAANAYFFTLANLHDESGQLRPSYADRANMHQIAVFDRKKIDEQLPALLKRIKANK